MSKITPSKHQEKNTSQNRTPSSLGMFFVVGRGRSGTSLLQQIFNSHPQISFPPEAQFVVYLYRKYLNTKWDRNKILNFYEDLFYETRLVNWNLDKKELKENLLNCKENITFEALSKIVYAQYGRTHQKENIKTTWRQKIRIIHYLLRN